MAAKYWIKLYHEILHERMMVQLDDRLWRRAIECFLLAGEQHEGGTLPDIKDMAFTLRCSEETLETELVELGRKGIVEQRAGGWFVTNFAKRQAKMDKAEYMRRLREKRQQEQYQGTGDVTEQLPGSYQTVTDSNADTDKIRLDKDTDKIHKGATAPKDHKTLLPSHLSVNPLLNAWGEWLQYHEDRGKPITTATALRQFKEFESIGPERAAAAINNSIGNNYTGLVEPKVSKNGETEPAGFAAVRAVQEEIEHGNT